MLVRYLLTVILARHTAFTSFRDKIDWPSFIRFIFHRLLIWLIIQKYGFCSIELDARINYLHDHCDFTVFFVSAVIFSDFELRTGNFSL